MIIKQLSSNDTGETGGHQGGILVPKKMEILNFFPTLPKEEKNPRIQLTFIDDAYKQWEFNFIYYNNKFFGGTRNEYRLTGMTKFFKFYHLKAGDKVNFNKHERVYKIGYERNNIPETNGKLKLTNSWITVKMK
ncbi:EcoRII N-terminal effector-binding domain-containing protein [Salinimicrobium terrae]|uniref:EcoRII N-terminal effector-binding domain-containing protein n=1 Tax=Salinimicrobium terrae TaxID=470866 RepID=UPI00040F47DA|nr:EcoRII N-terminal effector-binding domain-containing protein [Salinimicrobium terrae]